MRANQAPCIGRAQRLAGILPSMARLAMGLALVALATASPLMAGAPSSSLPWDGAILAWADAPDEMSSSSSSASDDSADEVEDGDDASDDAQATSGSAVSSSSSSSSAAGSSAVRQASGSSSASSDSKGSRGNVGPWYALNKSYVVEVEERFDSAAEEEYLSSTAVVALGVVAAVAAVAAIALFVRANRVRARAAKHR